VFSKGRVAEFLNNFDGFPAFLARVFINGHAALITHPQRDGKIPRPKLEECTDD
jgi:hypothetical protein